MSEPLPASAGQSRGVHLRASFVGFEAATKLNKDHGGAQDATIETKAES